MLKTHSIMAPTGSLSGDYWKTLVAAWYTNRLKILKFPCWGQAFESKFDYILNCIILNDVKSLSDSFQLHLELGVNYVE